MTCTGARHSRGNSHNGQPSRLRARLRQAFCRLVTPCCVSESRCLLLCRSAFGLHAPIICGRAVRGSVTGTPAVDL